MIAGALLLTGACKSAPDLAGDTAQPAVPNQSLQVVSQTLSDCTVKLSGTLESPDLELTVHKAIVELVVDGVVLHTREEDFKVIVPAGESRPVDLPETFTYVKDRAELIALDARAGSMLVTVRGQLVGSLKGADGVRPVQIAFAHSKDLRTPRLPKVKLVDLEAGRFSESEVQVLFHVGVVNPNPFDIMLTGLSYEAVLGGKKIAESFVGKGERVSAASTGVFEVQVALNEETYGAAVKHLIKSMVVPYSLTGKATTALSDATLEAKGEIKLRSTAQ